MPLRSCVDSTTVTPSWFSSAKQVQDLVAGLDVESGRRFVEEDDLGAGEQRPGEEDTLLLATRQVPDVTRPEAVQAQTVQHRVDLGAFPSEIHGVRHPVARAMPTHSATVTGKFQSICSTCGTKPTVRSGRR